MYKKCKVIGSGGCGKVYHFENNPAGYTNLAVKEERSVSILVKRI